MPEENRESQQEGDEDLGGDEIRRPRIIRELPNMVCRDGLTLLGGTMVLTEQEITLANGTPIRGRIDLSSPAPDQDSSSVEINKDDKNNKKSISIPLESIESITYAMALGRPSLVFGWKDNTRAFGKARRTEFIQRAGKGKERKEDRLVTWVPVIDEVKNAFLNPSQNGDDGDGEQQTGEEKEAATETQTVAAPIDTTKLESEIVSVLDQKDWKGPFQIANELRDMYGGKYDFDLVETLCKKLAKDKAIEGDKAGEFFRRKK
jgi:hypothetical protein